MQEVRHVFPARTYDIDFAGVLCNAEFVSQASGLITVRARQTGAFVFLETLRPAPLPAEFRDAAL